MKVVLDTNLWLSAWLWQGLPKELIELAKKGEVCSCTSLEILQELKKVLSYRKLQKRLAILSLTSEDILIGMQEISVIFPIQPLEVPELRDPKDAMVLATAIASQADAIISGDSDLLILETYQNIPILTAKQFLDSL
ncbi:putative toxin-antitoxin system toxin component, PIN family [Synechocystis sp. FACHB-383]|uniref:putative toxin-antitoxin system toxin component, PIN family n=1 Tax=Synechocystis sp. FACHB-383 TaxID=2692864 RepID=UPI001683042B|nr:putative toxin-antitoxin system toxin component, PIN family [Synechocystis sp. FACHB-383]MBD2653256.1 putative toxin-antitoxin system toxin component, PIN family [Synechocystis sp. FACHB-383]